jgi:hypothetical protein
MQGRSSGVAWQAHHRMTADQYQAIFNQLTSQGYRLTWVSTYAVSGEDFYAAIWDKSAGPAWQAHHRMKPSDYRSTFDAMLSQGYWPACISASNTGGDDLLRGAMGAGVGAGLDGPSRQPALCHRLSGCRARAGRDRTSDAISADVKLVLDRRRDLD